MAPIINSYRFAAVGGFPDGLGSDMDMLEYGTMSRTAHNNFPTADEDWASGAYSSSNYVAKTSAPTSVTELTEGTLNFWMKPVSNSAIQGPIGLCNPSSTTSLKDNWWIHYRG